MSSLIEIVGGALVVALGSGGLGAAVVKARAAKQVQAARTAQGEAERAWTRIDKIEARLEDCESTKAQCLQALATAGADAAIARADVGRLATRVAELIERVPTHGGRVRPSDLASDLARADDDETTGLHEVREIARSSAAASMAVPPFPARTPDDDDDEGEIE